MSMNGSELSAKYVQQRYDVGFNSGRVAGYEDGRREGYALGMQTEREHQEALARLVMKKYQEEIAELEAQLQQAAGLQEATTPVQEWRPLSGGILQLSEREAVRISGNSLEVLVRPLETFYDSVGEPHQRLLMWESVSVDLPEDVRLFRRVMDEEANA
jgi:hypothetical protein